MAEGKGVQREVEFEGSLKENQKELIERIYRGKYTPDPVRRKEIPKRMIVPGACIQQKPLICQCGVARHSGRQEVLSDPDTRYAHAVHGWP